MSVNYQPSPTTMLTNLYGFTMGLGERFQVQVFKTDPQPTLFHFLDFKDI